MKIASQIIVDLTSLAVALLAGIIFNTAFWQIGYHARQMLAGKPLPAITEFFVANSHLTLYTVLTPWLWLVGAPLLSRYGTRNYWEATAFILRFLAFACCEIFFSLVMALAACLPFVSYYWVLRSGERSTVETTVMWAFWTLTAAVLVGSIYRTFQWYVTSRGTG